jgi:hypothetical protein
MLDSSTLLQSNQSDGWSKERESEKVTESRKPRHSCAVSAPIFFILFLSFPHNSKSFPDDFGIILVQPAAAHWCLVVTGHKPKLEQVSSHVRLPPRLSGSKPRTRNLPSKLQVPTKKSPSHCNGGKGGRCSGRRPWIRSWSLQSRHNHGGGARSSKGAPVLPLAVDVPHAVSATGRSWPRRGCHRNSTCVESGRGQAERGRGGQRHADGWAEWASQLELRTAQGPPARLRQAPDPSHSRSVWILWNPKLPLSSWAARNFHFCCVI